MVMEADPWSEAETAGGAPQVYRAARAAQGIQGNIRRAGSRIDLPNHSME
jgi:hypothetical protein